MSQGTSPVAPGGPASRIRWITVTIGGRMVPAVIHRGETPSELLTVLRVAHGVDMDSLRLHTAEGMVLAMSDDVWSMVGDGETLFAFSESANTAQTNPAGVRCPECWQQ